MKHEVLFLGKTGAGYLEEGIQEYLKRLKHYTSCSVKTLKCRAKKGRSQQQEEAQALLSAVPAGAIKVVLDSRGKSMSSEDLAEQVSRWEMSGVRQVSYLIGGPEGHLEEVVRTSDVLLSFSKMTFTHDMIRLLLLEQLYRAYTIKAGEKYHK